MICTVLCAELECFLLDFTALFSVWSRLVTVNARAALFSLEASRLKVSVVRVKLFCFRFWHVWCLTYLSCTTEWQRLSVRQHVFYPVCLSLLNPALQTPLKHTEWCKWAFLIVFVIAALNDYVIVASIIAIRNSINCAALMCSIILVLFVYCSKMYSF